MKAENKSLPIHKNELKIEVNQAQEIEPGAEIEVAIQVKDAKGRPAKNVDLTAAAISKKFEDYSESFMTPYIAASKNKYPRGKGKNIYFKVDEIDKRKRISDDTYNKFNLDSSLDYRMRFPENGIRKEYIKLDDELKESAQFIPLIVEKGEYQYPYSIHLDRNSIYYHDAPQSYVFVASAGMHKIDVRLYDALITLDSVELRKGYKLIISVDKDLISKVENAKYQVKDEYWDTYELRNRKLTIIQLRNSTYEDTYLYQKGRKIYKISRYNSKYIGPFHPKDSLVYLEQYHLQKTTEFEGSFAYYFKPDNDRLYEFQLDDTEKK
ncbi:MAG: hypothetical protein ACPG5P_09410, partial [Saprospiraceae bacterium]